MEERPRLNAHKNPPSRVATWQPNLLLRASDTSPEKLMSAMASEPTTQAKRETMYKKKYHSQKECVVYLIPMARAVHNMLAY